MNTYRFMSCNVRLQMEHDGINQFYNRAEFLGKTLEEIRPDVIGFQELTCAMRLTLMKHLPSYFIAGGGRDASRLDESPAIAFLKDRFLLEQLSTEILSMTPHIPGTTYGGDQSICPRAFCTAVLMPVSGGRPFRFLNVHTDHAGAQARMFASMQMLQALSRANESECLPTVITGDFNATPESPEIRLITEYTGFRLTDATAALPPTYHDFDALPCKVKIDYIFLSDEWEVKKAESFHTKNGDLFLSDHDPVMVTCCETAN